MRRRGKRGLESRQKILDAASTLYRQHGFSGVGVLAIASAAGMTHGGFYTQFPHGKEELLAAVVVQAFRDGQKDWDEWIEGFPEDLALVTIIEDYLSSRHCANPEVGCPVAALAADVSRQGPSVKSAFTEGVKAELEALSELYSDSTAPERRINAMRLLTRLAGTILIARAIDDPALSYELLAAARIPDSI
ncbi:TetR/AcrR family transcriptional regulator [Pseudomonas gingeri]|uniref:TetR/AcrR family transcriptional regulator n=1 Tax=Pseudomonas gingeri TaxID=117681 RepID=A0A7Y7XAS5_9PSED|nr:TetR/AcrR family transcriptional regulator [Pseudomonas gingeri]NWB96458.1 TetR/AcrR family transcriptional regulator [Pseudomonas gingeri]